MKSIISFIILLVSVVFISPVTTASSVPPAKKNTTNKTVQTKSGRKTKSNSKKSISKPKTENLTREEMNRRQSAAQKEIIETRKQIAENDKSIRKSLESLKRISAEIGETQKSITMMNNQISTLDNHINSLNNDIQKQTKELENIRKKYLVSLKKMRLTKGKTSALAFIFAAKDFNQALRRMRYLKEFATWRDKQTALIDSKVKKLKYETELLSQSKADQNRLLGHKINAQQELKNKHASQDLMVTELRKNGETLNQHLRKKQAEANDLRNRIAAVIAEEQRRAEQQRRAAEEKERREQEAKQRRRQEEQRRQQLAQSNETLKKDETTTKTEKNPDLKSDIRPKKESKPDTKKTEKINKPESTSKTQYAEARRRKPRNKNTEIASTVRNEAKKVENEKKVSNFKNFEDAKGSLPRPVSGTFRITSPFGRHSLPELPDVMYDNPGIDAEVSKGATALAVFEGKVSGIYVLPGYNNVIIINHGNYYTIYGNISAPSVKVGEHVRQGQGIGKVAVNSDDDSRSSIHFELWRNREKLNPQSWLR